MSVRDVSVLLFRQETTYGVYATPVPATDAMLVFGHEIVPMESEQVTRQIEKGFAGANPTLPTAVRQRQRFSVELAGSGAAGTPAFWDRLLRSCLFDASQVLAAPARVLYPLSTAGDGVSGSIAGFKDGLVRARMRGSRGNARFIFEEKQIPSIAFDFVGLLEGSNPIDAGAPGAVTLPTPPAGVECSLTNTVIQLDTFTLGVRRLEIDLGNKVEFFSTTGQRAIIYGKDESGDRRAATGTIVFELPDPATRNFFTSILPATPLAFSLVHGTAAGNIFRITSSRAILGEATFSVEQNRLFMNAPITFVPNAAGNELTIETL